MSKRGYVVSRKEQRLIESTGGSAVYGEVQPSGIGAVLDVLCGACEDEQEHEVKAAEHRVFMDLGSGLGRCARGADPCCSLCGARCSVPRDTPAAAVPATEPPVRNAHTLRHVRRVVLQAALSPRSHSPATGQPWFNQYVGLELSPSRLEQSLHVLDRLRQQVRGRAVVPTTHSARQRRRAAATCGVLMGGVRPAGWRVGGGGAAAACRQAAAPSGGPGPQRRGGNGGVGGGGGRHVPGAAGGDAGASRVYDGVSGGVSERAVARAV